MFLVEKKKLAHLWLEGYTIPDCYQRGQRRSRGGTDGKCPQRFCKKHWSTIFDFRNCFFCFMKKEPLKRRAPKLKMLHTSLWGEVTFISDRSCSYTSLHQSNTLLRIHPIHSSASIQYTPPHQSNTLLRYGSGMNITLESRRSRVKSHESDKLLFSWSLCFLIIAWIRNT